MTGPVAPALTVRFDGSQRTFAAGNDVVIGRDLRADVRIAHPLISRAHLVLRIDRGRWQAIDNGSLNGMYVHGRRVPAVDIADGMAINIGNPDGPLLSFELGRNTGSVGTPPPTAAVPVTRPPLATGPGGYPSQPSGPMYPTGGAAYRTGAPPSTPPPRPPYPTGPGAQSGYQSPPSQPVYPTSGTYPTGYPPSASQPVREQPQPANLPTQMGPAAAAPKSADGNLATSMLKILRPGRAPEVPAGGIKIGRATDNDIVIPDVLASRHHATLVPSAGGVSITRPFLTVSENALRRSDLKPAARSWSQRAVSASVLSGRCAPCAFDAAPIGMTTTGSASKRALASGQVSSSSQTPAVMTPTAA